MVEAALEFFFSMIKWVFNDFLLKIKILNIPVLYLFLAILLLGIVINGLINKVSAGSLILNSSRSKSDNSSPDMRMKMDI